MTFNLYSNPNARAWRCSPTHETSAKRHGHIGRLHGDGAGTGHWVATYNGDTNNSSVTGSSGPVTITPAAATTWS